MCSEEGATENNTNRKTKTFSRRHAADEAPASGLASMRFPGDLLKPAARPDHLAARRDAADETCTAGKAWQKKVKKGKRNTSSML